MPGRGGRSDEQLQRAVFALNNRRPDEAERIARETLRANPNHPVALQVLGRSLLVQGRNHDAVTLLEPAARSRHDPEIETQLAIGLRKLGRRDEALARLKRATKRPPAYVPALRELGSLLYEMTRYDEAIAVLRGAVDAAPMMPDLWIQLGFACMQRKNHDDAKSAFARALQIAPGVSDALFGLGRLHMGLREYEPAIVCLRQYLMSKPEHSEAWLSLGHCLLELGQLESGYECFRAAARGDARRAGVALASLVKSGRGRFWLRPSAAARFLLQAKR